ncbi:MAG: DUF2167 domain-containing protein [Limnohabitans sp.]|nr:DUF2167 domain-containing protein [Limnohabitans sp.]
MKNIIIFLCAISTFWGYSQTEEDTVKQLDSIEKTFKYERGTIKLAGGIGTIKVPVGFKYLNSAQSERVLVDLWGNPKSETPSLGMLLPENQGVMTQNGYVFNIEYDEIGYVEDDDADDINYDDLLADMKKESVEENEQRKKEGYEPVTIIGWASTPFYDKDRKILHWAKEVKFGKDQVNTLNYNIRILGRKGVLVLNAISTMNEFPLVKKDVNKVLDVVQFGDGFKYEQFDSSVDNVAAWTIGGLVAGKVLAKVGFFGIILKFGKFIVIGLLAFAGKIKNMIFGSKEQEVTRPVAFEEKEEENTPEQE